jgi:hypothetical protein
MQIYTYKKIYSMVEEIEIEAESKEEADDEIFNEYN